MLGRLSVLYVLFALFAHRRHLTALTLADLRQRWSGGAIAWGWVVVQPIAQITIFAVVFSSILVPRGGKFADPQVYIVYLSLGFFTWLAVSEGLVRGTGSLIENAGLLRRTPLPLALFPVKATLAAWCLCLIALLLTLAAAPFLGCPVRWTWTLLPIPVLSLVLLAMGAAMALSALNVLIRDVGQVLALLLPLLLWTAPVIYVPDILPIWAQKAQVFHPLAPALVMLHGLVIDGALPSLRVWLLVAAYPVLALLAGWLVMRSLDDEIRDVL